jgi:hypothetical protein
LIAPSWAYFQFFRISACISLAALMGYLFLWPEEGLNSLSSNLKLPGPDGLSFFRVVAAARLATLRNCVIHRYASSQGHATGLLKLQNLLVRELARELVEQPAKG